MTWALVVAVGGAIVWRVAGWQRDWVVPLVLGVAQLPHALVVWHADTLEIDRHALVVGVTTRLSFLLLSLFIVDALRSASSTKRPPTASMPDVVTG